MLAQDKERIGKVKSLLEQKYDIQVEIDTHIRELGYKGINVWDEIRAGEVKPK